MNSRIGLTLALLAGFAASSPVNAQQNTITVSSTTSTEQSGLFAHLLPAFTKKTGIEVKVVAVGTGQALDIGRRGDADVVFVHDKAAEENFLAEGGSTKRIDVMYNDFIIVGPKGDTAKAQGKDVLEGLRKISAAKQPFISRGDRSGTHAAELRYWKDAGVDLTAKPDWYKEIGQGMGPTLNMASGTNGYTLTDRGTWLSFKNRQDLDICLLEPDGSIRKVAVKKADGRYRIKTGIKAGKTKVLGKLQVFFIRRQCTVNFGPADHLDASKDGIFDLGPHNLCPVWKAETQVQVHLVADQHVIGLQLCRGLVPLSPRKPGTCQ